MDLSDDASLALLAEDVDCYYERLVLMYWHQLKSFIARRVGNPQDAEDVVQEALLRAYTALERYPLERIRSLKARPWLYKITWNVYCNHANRSKQGLLTPLDPLDETLLEREDESDDHPESVFARQEQRQELEMLLATLPQHYRIVVSMYYLEELSQQEIADILHQPLGTVKVYMRRGIRLLRKAIEMQADKVR